MIERWRAVLERHGFMAKKWVSREVSFVKDNRIIRQSLWEESNRKGGIRINVDLLLKDDFYSDPIYQYPVMKRGCLSEEGVVLPLLGQGSGRYWTDKEEEMALAALEKYGIPWLEKNGVVERLIAELEEALLEGVHGDEKGRSLLGKLAERSIFRQSGIAGPAVRRPPSYNYYLSLLYHHVKNSEKACSYAQKWLDFCKQPGVPPPGEPERTLKQLSVMGCTDFNIYI